MNVTPPTLETLSNLLDEGNPHKALEVGEDLLRRGGDQPELRYLIAEAQRDLGAFALAAAHYEAALRHGSFSAARSGLAAMRFETLDFSGARASSREAIREDPANPEAYYVRAMLRERRGDSDGAWRDYRRAAQLDPLQFPLPVRMDDAAVERVVEEVLEGLDPDVRKSLARVLIVLEEVPHRALCRSFDPPASPSSLLGLFNGPRVFDATGYSSDDVLPPEITLFRCNLQRIAHSPAELRDELRITLLHEIGHYLGLEEHELDARGLG